MIFRKSKNRWAATPVAAAEDRSLSLEARGLLWYLLVKPDSWEVKTEDLLRSGAVGSSPDTKKGRLMGEKTLRRLVFELEDAGYMRRKVENTRHGAEWITEIFDTPLPESERISHKGRTRQPQESNQKQAPAESPSVPEGNLGSDSPSAPSPSFPEGHLACINILNNQRNYKTTHDLFSFSDAEAEKPRGAGAPEEKKPECEENSPPFSLPEPANIPEIIETGARWLEKYCPLVAPHRSTAEFLAYHEGEATEFTSQEQFLRSWRGWMRNAQRMAAQRAETRAQRESNGQTRKPHAESANLRNLRDTIDFFGPPPPGPTVSSRELIRAAGAAMAQRQRAASDELIRKSIARYRAGRDSQ